MAKMNLSSMSVEALLQLRDDVGRALARKTTELQHQLAALGKDAGVGRGRGRRGSSAMKGQKVAPKYRGSGGETWAGRGAMPRWMTEAIKEGKKREDFLIDKSAAASTRSATKRRPARKRRAKK
jgi:DNA-binding protein H-NS